MLFTLRCTFCAGSSITSFTATLPRSTVPAVPRVVHSIAAARRSAGMQRQQQQQQNEVQGGCQHEV